MCAVVSGRTARREIDRQPIRGSACRRRYRAGAMGHGGRAHRVVVVGGGFGGLQAVRHLRRAPVEVTLVDRQNFHLFQPLDLPGRDGRAVARRDRLPAARDLQAAANVRVLLAEVTDFDLDGARRACSAGCRRRPAPATLPYDTLVVAGGSRYSYFGHDEWQHARAGAEVAGGRARRSAAGILSAFEAAERGARPRAARAPGSRSSSSAPGRPASRWPARSASSPATRCARDFRAHRPARRRACCSSRRPTAC